MAHGIGRHIVLRESLGGEVRALLVLVMLGLCISLCVGLWMDVGASMPWAEG